MGPFLELGVGDSVSGGESQDFPYHLSLADLDGILVWLLVIKFDLQIEGPA